MNTNLQNSILTQKIKNIVDARLQALHINRDILNIKELSALLNCSERTIRRWNQLRTQGNKNIGIEFHQDNPKFPIKYFLEDIYQYFINNMI